MKYIKTYEKYKFNLDEYVKIISGYDDKTSPYYQKLLKIIKLSDPKFKLYKLKDITKPLDTIYWPPKDLEKATEEEVEKFLLEINTDKYNI